MQNLSQNHLMHTRVKNNHIDNGYFPTDDETVKGICRRLDSTADNVRIFDPCCGTGKALADIGQYLTECGSSVASFGVELNHDRTDEACQVLTHALCADFENTQLTYRTVGLLFLNPPYGFGLSDGLSNDKTKRLEEKFFDTSWHTLQAGGICVLIIPTQSLQKGFVANIASHLSHIQIFRAAVDTYNQVVIMGVRPAKLSDIANDTVREQINIINNWEHATKITDEAKHWYFVPQTPNVAFHPINREIDPEHLYQNLPVLRNKTLWQNFDATFSGTLKQGKRRPLMPLSQWHTALALAAGQVEGIVENKDGRRLLVKGATHKTKDTKITEEYDNQGNRQTITTHTDKFIPCIRAVDLTVGSADFGRVLTIQ